MRRIVIVGPTGSGKTTFGRKLAARLNLPVTDLDDLHWLPGWVERPRDEFFALAEAAAGPEAWVIVGNYSKTRPLIWPRAEAVIWLDYPFPRVFWQLLRRSILRAIDKNPICNGNTESWRQFFSKKSIMLWLFSSYRRVRSNYAAIFSGEVSPFDAGGKTPKITYIRFESPAAAESWLQKLEA
jgi:adenylate kinase family enzyme